MKKLILLVMLSLLSIVVFSQEITVDTIISQYDNSQFNIIKFKDGVEIKRDEYISNRIKYSTSKGLSSFFNTIFYYQDEPEFFEGVEKITSEYIVDSVWGEILVNDESGYFTDGSTFHNVYSQYSETDYPDTSLYRQMRGGLLTNPSEKYVINIDSVSGDTLRYEHYKRFDFENNHSPTYPIGWQITTSQNGILEHKYFEKVTKPELLKYANVIGKKDGFIATKNFTYVNGELIEKTIITEKEIIEYHYSVNYGGSKHDRYNCITKLKTIIESSNPAGNFCETYILFDKAGEIVEKKISKY